MPKNKRPILNGIYILFLMSLPIVFFSLPKNYFDDGHSICLSILLLNTKCIGCGITRAIQHAIHFDFEIAWKFNKLVIIVLPVLLFIWGSELVKKIRDLIKK